MASVELERLRDLLDEKKMRELEKLYGDEFVFPAYKDKSEIGLKIFKALNQRLINLGDGKLGIPMDDDEKKVGLLSQCQGLQTLVSLVNDFDLDFDDTGYDTRHHRSIRNIMDAILKDVINYLRDTGEEIEEDVDEAVDPQERFRFDASPYDSIHFGKEIGLASIETITWVLPTFFQILSLHVKERQVCKWERNIIRVIRNGLDYINNAYIGKDKNIFGKGLQIGWNFTKNCEEPSLYFTFSVGECYLDLYNTFARVLVYPYGESNNREYGIDIDEDARKEFIAHREKYHQEEIDNANLEKGQARHDEYNELVRLFHLISHGETDVFAVEDPFEDLQVSAGRYGALEARVKEVAKAVWKYVQADLADKFFYNDLDAKLTEEDLRMSTTSDALFNTVYIVNILIDAGMDETLRMEMLQAERLSQNADEKSEKQRWQRNMAAQKQREYTNLLESCQLAVQRAFRTYESLKNEGKEYIVDQFLVGFNERFSTHKDLANDLRKLRMRVFSLLPLLIHTNNVINAYLVQYPNVNMQKYAEYILDNRYVGKSGGKVEWIWEKDGYFSGSNYYYVYALNELYEYYEKYEKRYIASSKDPELIRQEYYKELTGKRGEITALEAEIERAKQEKEQLIAKHNAKIAAMEQLLEEERRKMPTVEDSLRTLIREEMDQRIVACLTQTFAQAAKALAPGWADPTQDEGEQFAGMYQALLDMAVAESFGRHRFAGDCTPEFYEEQVKYFKNDLRAIINHNIDDIDANTNNQSNMLKNLG